MIVVLSLLISILGSFNNSLTEDRIFTHRLNESILVVQFGEVYPDQVVAIKTSEGIIMVDAGISPSLAKKYRQRIIKEFGDDRFLFLINTHAHFDHSNGNQVFNDAQVIAHKDAKQQMISFDKNRDQFIESRTARIKRRFEVSRSLSETDPLFKRFEDLRLMSEFMIEDYAGEFKLRLPEIEVENKKVIKLTDLNIFVFDVGEGFHSDADVVVYVPELKLLVSGDIIGHQKVHPNLSSFANLEKLKSVLDSINEMGRPEILITSHAGILDSESYLDFFSQVKLALENKKNNGAWFHELMSDFNPPNIQSLIANKSVEDLNNLLSEADALHVISELLNKNHFEIALEMIEKIILSYPDSEDLIILRAECLRALGDTTRAKHNYELVMKMNPLNSYVYEQLFFMNKSEK